MRACIVQPSAGNAAASAVPGVAKSGDTTLQEMIALQKKQQSMVDEQLTQQKVCCCLDCSVAGAYDWQHCNRCTSMSEQTLFQKLEKTTGAKERKDIMKVGHGSSRARTRVLACNPN